MIMRCKCTNLVLDGGSLQFTRHAPDFLRVCLRGARSEAAGLRRGIETQVISGRCAWKISNWSYEQRITDLVTKAPRAGLGKSRNIT